MKLTQRFKRLSLWNKLAAIGSLASIVAIPLAILFYTLPNIEGDYVDSEIMTDTLDSANNIQVLGSNVTINVNSKKEKSDYLSIPKAYAAYKNRALGVAVLLTPTEENESIESVGLTPEDIYFCIRWATTHSDRDMFVNFEPTPSGESCYVKYGKELENTHLGFLLYKADLALKEYALGYRIDGMPIKSIVKVYPGMVKQLQKKSYSKKFALFSRFWLQPNPVLATDSSKRFAIVSSPRINLLSSSLGPEQDNPGKPFAQAFSDHFHQFSAENDHLRAFVHIVQIMALARWLSDVVPDEAVTWLQQRSLDTHTTPMQIKSLRIEKTSEPDKDGLKVKTTTVLEGGVRLSENEVFKMVMDDALDVPAAIIEKAVKKNQDSDFFKIDVQPGTYNGYVVPISMK